MARWWAAVVAEARAGSQAFIALALNSSTSFIAGAFLGSVTSTFVDHPGLLVLVPAAALRSAPRAVTTRP